MFSIEEVLKSARETRELAIGVNIIDTFPALFAAQFPGKKAIIVADTTTFNVAGKTVSELLYNAGLAQDEPFVFAEPELHAEYHHVEQLLGVLTHTDAIPVAVGSGTINDLTKLAAYLSDRRYCSVATAASMDGYTSFGASITYQDIKQNFDCPAPQAILADIEIIRKAPAALTASGYADLFAKVPAGADWILADALGIEAIEPMTWSIVQDGLRNALASPEGACAGEIAPISSLIEGLMLGGFAMQWSRKTRCASGAEHQFSHLWDMEHHTHNGKAPSHGFKVGIATLYISALYEQLLNHPVDRLDIVSCCAKWPEWEQQEERAKQLFAGTDLLEMVLTELKNKYITREELALQLSTFKARWPEIKSRLSRQLFPFEEVKRRLQLAGAPVEPEDIGISRDRLRDSFFRAQQIRSRFTILDLAVRMDCLDLWLKQIFDD